MPLDRRFQLKLPAFVIALAFAFLTGCAQSDSQSPRVAESPSNQPGEKAAAAPNESVPPPSLENPAEPPRQEPRAMNPPPSEDAPTATSDNPSSSPVPSAADPTNPESQRPHASHVPPWAILREPFEPLRPIVFDCKWTGGIRLEINTDNVQRVTLDLHELPPDAPQSGPWILQIDRQGIEITGRRGKIIDLVRSPNGVWSVDRESAPLRR